MFQEQDPPPGYFHAWAHLGGFFLHGGGGGGTRRLSGGARKEPSWAGQDGRTTGREGSTDERAHSPFSRAPEPTDRLRSMWGRERERIEARRAATCRGRKKTILLAARWVKHEEYTVWRTLGRDVLFCFISEVLVTNWAAQ